MGLVSVFFRVKGPVSCLIIFLGVKGPVGRLTKTCNNVIVEFLRVRRLRVIDKLIKGGFLNALTIGVIQFSRIKRLRITNKPTKGGLLRGNNDIVISLLR